MTKALQTRTDFDDAQMKLLKNTIAEGTTNDEFAMFLEVCKRKNLDPFSKQVYCIVYKGKNRKVSIQMSIDGYRVQASRSGLYAGNDDILYNDTLTQYEHLKAFKGTKNPYPVTATATVYKMMGGVRVPFAATCNWFDYYPGDDFKGQMWRNFPYTMLGKVAEALALRKAFPDQLEGLYVEEEMHQASALPLEAPPEKERTTPPNANDIRDIKIMAQKANVDFYDFASQVTGKPITIDIDIDYKRYAAIREALLDTIQIEDVEFTEEDMAVGKLEPRTGWDAPRTGNDNKNLHTLGLSFFVSKEEWDGFRTTMVQEVTEGRETSSAKITHGEAQTLIMFLRVILLARELKGDEWPEWIVRWTTHLFGAALEFHGLLANLGYDDLKRLHDKLEERK